MRGLRGVSHYVLVETSHWFMAADCARVAIGFLLFIPIALLPGYGLGYATKLFDFRQRSAEAQAAIALALSIAIGPLLSFLLGSWLGLSGLSIIYGVIAAGSLALLVRHRDELRITRPTWRLWAIAGCWLILGTLSTIDLQIGHRLYFSIISYDTCIRAPMVHAIATFGLPARSPFFFPGHAAPLRYHFFWLIQAALVEHFGRGWLDARQAYIAGGLWCGLGLLAVIALYIRFFGPVEIGDVRRRIGRAWLLLGVTGLDILPSLLFVALTKAKLIQLIPPSVEWWNEQVDGWVYTMLWEPHYIAALIAYLTGFLVLWQAADAKRFRDRAIASVVAGGAFGGGVGLSIYVAFVFAAFLTIWLIIIALGRRYRECISIVAAGTLALVLALPFLNGLQGGGSGGQPLQFSVRSFLVFDLVSKAAEVSKAVLAISDLLLLPLNYFLELGFFFVVGALMIKRLRKGKALSRHEVALASMTAASVLICTFVRSGTIDHNDLGWRGFLIAQFALLLAAIEFRSKGVLKRSPLITFLLILGAAGTVYDLFLLRFFAALSDEGLTPKIAWISADAKVGRRTYANRKAYEWLRAHSEPTAVIQQSPYPVLQDVFYGLYADRQTAAEDNGCVTPFGGDPADCQQLLTGIKPLYKARREGSGTDLKQACATSPVDFFLAKDTDPEWPNRESWIWRTAPVYANDFVRIFNCENGITTHAKAKVRPAPDEPDEY